MKIGVIASMEAELKYIKESMSDVSVKNILGTEYYEGRINESEIVMCICRTGKVHMAVSAQKMIDNFDLELIINCGVAGALKDGIVVGDVVLATKTLQTDMDVQGLGYEIGMIPDIDMKFFDQYEKINPIAKELMDDYDFKVYFGNIMTADKFVSSSKDKEYLISNFDGYCTDMETASLAQVCYINDMPFAGIRGMSDSANSGASNDFATNLQVASDNCAKVLVDILAKL